MELKNYDIVLGSFRVNSCKVYNEFINQRVLVDTGVSYNVDQVLRDLPDNFDICTKFGVDHLNNFDFYMTRHLDYLERDFVSYGLVHFYEEGWDKLYQKIEQDPRIHVAGVSNFNIENLKEFYQIFGKYPAVNEIEFSLRYHDLELVKFCRDNNIEVLAYAVLGGIHASKLFIREYLLEELLGFVYSNGAIPIIRTDCSEHAEACYRVYQKLKSGVLKINELDITSDSYELNASVSSDRALNKFKYDIPHHAIEININGEILQTLDSRTLQLLGTLGIKNLSAKVIPIDSPNTGEYVEGSRDYMMITDYLVLDKFLKSKPYSIMVSDDVLIDKSKRSITSYQLINKKGFRIKSGSEEAKLMFKKINY